MRKEHKKRPLTAMSDQKQIKTIYTLILTRIGVVGND